MGSWSVSCGISNIAITSGNECCIIPLKENRSEYGGYLPITLPIFGEYNDYGGMENIVVDENTKLIEKHLGITIDEFVEFLVDGEFTFDRREVRPIREKLEANGKLEEVADWRFMWVDKKVYDVMVKNYDEWEKGHHDFGTPEFMKLLGFTLVEEDKIDNYDPNRFNKKYQKGDLFVYSDGRTMLSEKGRYIYYTDKGCESSLATYITIPEELQYIKYKTKPEIWRLMSPKKYKQELGYIFGRRYDFDMSEGLLDKLIQSYKEAGEKVPEEFIKPKTIYEQYFDNMEEFGDKIVGLCNVRNNLHPMSGRFFPHVMYLTPQCGEYEHHQILLEEFVKINKSYIYNENEE